MSALNSIAMFKDEAHARLCFHYARSRYPNVEMMLNHATWCTFPWSIAIDIIGVENQRAVEFIEGAAYMLGDASCIPALACKGDKRDRYPYSEDAR